MNSALFEALYAALCGADADASVRAVVLTGADPAFCAGVDLKEAQRSGGARQHGQGRVDGIVFQRQLLGHGPHHRGRADRTLGDHHGAGLNGDRGLSRFPYDPVPAPMFTTDRMPARAPLIRAAIRGSGRRVCA